MVSDTYSVPEHGWTCFHCGETLTTPGAAEIHFGPVPSAVPGCLLKVQPGDERGLLMALRKVEVERDEAKVRLTALRLGADEEDCVRRFHAGRQISDSGTGESTDG